MDPSMLGWVLTGIIALFVVLGVFFGVLRGLRKTLSRGVWLILTALVLVLITGWVTQGLFVMDISFLKLEIEGVAVTSIRQLVEEYLSLNLEIADFTNAKELIDYFIALASLLLNSIVFILLFWITKYLFIPLNMIFTKTFFTSDKEKLLKILKKEYKLLIKSRKRVEDVVSFADKDNDLFEEELEPIKEEKINPLEELRQRLGENRAKAKKQIDKKNQTDEGIVFVDKIEKEEKEEEVVVEQAVEQKKPMSTLEPIWDEIVKTQEEQKEKFKPKEEYEPEFKIKKQELKQKIDSIKVKKHRFLGGLVGAFVGLFIAAMTLSPIIGIFSLAAEIDKEEAVFIVGQEDKGIITALTDGLFAEINKAYEESVGVSILKYTGMQWVATSTFDKLASTKIGEGNISLKEDLLQIIKTTGTVYRFTSVDFEDLSRENLAHIIELSLESLDSVFEIKLVSNLVQKIIAFANDYIESTETISFEDPDMQTIFDAMRANIAQLTNSEYVKNEIKALMKVAEKVNEEIGESGESLLSSMLNPDVDIFATIKSLEISYVEELIDSFFAFNTGSNIYETKTIPALLPLVTNFLLSKLSEEMEIDFEANEELTSEDVQEVIKVLIIESLEVISKIENNDGFIPSSSVFKSLGKILDIAKNNILTETSYQSIVSKLEETILDFIVNSEEISFLEEVATVIIGNLSEIESFEQEFTTFANALVILLEGTETEAPAIEKNPDTGDFEINIEKIGEVLDELENTVLFGGIYTEGDYEENKLNNLTLTLNGAMGYLIDKLNSQQEGEEENILFDFLPILDLIKDNMVSTINNTDVSTLTNNEIAELESQYDFVRNSNNEVVSMNINWNAELQKFVKLIDVGMEIYKVSSSETFVEDLLSKEEEDNLLVKLGEAFDDLDNSILFGNRLTYNIVDKVMGLAENAFITEDMDEGIENAVSGFFSKIRNKLSDSVEVDSWEKEFKHLLSFASIEFPSSTSDFGDILVGFGSVVDSIVNNASSNDNSKLILNSDCVDLVNDLISANIEELIPDGNLGDSIRNAVDSIQLNLESKKNSSIEWETEMEALAKFVSLDLEGGLGHLALSAKGLYFKYQHIFEGVYGNEEDGIGKDIDEILALSNGIITTNVIDPLIETIIDSYSIPNDFSSIIETVNTRLQMGDNDLKILSYNMEFKYLQYLLDITSLIEDEEGDFESADGLEELGGYFDDITSSLLIGDCGTTVLQNSIDNAFENEDLSAFIGEVNSTVETILDIEISSFKNIMDNNVESLVASNKPYAEAFKGLGDFKNALENLSFDLEGGISDEIAIGEAERISQILSGLQTNKIVKFVATRYLGIYLADSMNNTLRDIATAKSKPHDETYYMEYMNSLKEIINLEAPEGDLQIEIYYADNYTTDPSLVALYAETINFGLIKLIEEFFEEHTGFDL